MKRSNKVELFSPRSAAAACFLLLLHHLIGWNCPLVDLLSGSAREKSSSPYKLKLCLADTPKRIFLLLLPVAVATSCCCYQLLLLPVAVATSCCCYQLLLLPVAVATRHTRVVESEIQWSSASLIYAFSLAVFT